MRAAIGANDGNTVTDAMSAAAPTRPAEGDLAVVYLLGRLLEAMEQGRMAVNAVQYRSVAGHLSQELERVAAGPKLDTLLGQLPAAAELYENLRYAQAGLCRTPLDRAVESERTARAELERIAAL